MVVERQERTSPLLLPVIEMMMENLLRIRQIMGGPMRRDETPAKRSE
jgi:hypothetical protein